MLGAFPLCVVSASAEPPAPQCGVNLEAPQIASAVKSLRPAFRTINVAWAPNPYDGNYDPCATLSTALVTIKHATGSSPNQALLFHYGVYLGTATWYPYAFTSLDKQKTTNDTIVLDYKDGRDVCTACAGPVNAVRCAIDGSATAFRWSIRHRLVDDRSSTDETPPNPDE
jgi:hypothetical protein